ncbi:uncharacterized protein BDR25DRAFT_364484 [Lindgomyces ingoldianus]|uniref:Uncharacterized protein n=1 Tax=Lindgomyces ingoldianus TaxID=673940 RepID=A0ACB6REA6_9PLEO|nr:uncharacterized protein BDR25DRAFT_364484 [Lindgomyces ingoldianus]KAF2477613.1 hypothetical protein BDR25DRAFT_364484 [Lindgomyces ingoldianus]
MSQSSVGLNDPTTEANSTPSHATAMPTKPSGLPLTLILAATPNLGIGKAGQLPWPSLKQEMGYFARVTKRVPAVPSSQSQPQPRKRINAVIMGRKTWDSIPLKFRPLKGRMNFVVTRDVGSEKWASTALRKGGGLEEGPIIVSSIQAAVEALDGEEVERRDVSVERAFVIGGGSVYKAALELPQTRRVLLTKIEREYECDTFFPVDLDGEEGKKEGWVKRSRKDLQDFVGEEVAEGGLEEQGVRFEFWMYEKGEDGACLWLEKRDKIDILLPRLKSATTCLRNAYYPILIFMCFLLPLYRSCSPLNSRNMIPLGFEERQFELLSPGISRSPAKTPQQRLNSPSLLSDAFANPKAYAGPVYFNNVAPNIRTCEMRVLRAHESGAT